MKLHLGCGRNYLEGYVNIDCTTTKQYIPGGVLKNSSLFMSEGEYQKQLQQLEFKVDKLARIEELEYPENSIKEIRCIHVLEHLPFRSAIRALKRFYGFLQSGGLLLLEVPNAEELFLRFKEADLQQRKILYELIFCNQCSPAEFHRSAWDPVILSAVLKEIGFKSGACQLLEKNGPINQV